MNICGELTKVPFDCHQISTFICHRIKVPHIYSLEGSRNKMQTRFSYSSNEVGATVIKFNKVHEIVASLNFISRLFEDLRPLLII